MNDATNNDNSTKPVLAPEDFIRDLLELRKEEFFRAEGTPLDRRKIAEYIYRVLTTPTDEKSTPVPGTPFIEEGVATLMSELKNRAENEDAFGAKAAAAALRFLTQKDGNATQIHGASISSLQLLARASENLGLNFNGDAPST